MTHRGARSRTSEDATRSESQAEASQEPPKETKTPRVNVGYIVCPTTRLLQMGHEDRGVEEEESVRLKNAARRAIGNVRDMIVGLCLNIDQIYMDLKPTGYSDIIERLMHAISPI